MASISVPNWLEMPHDMIKNIFQRLSTIELLNIAQKVCTTWRIICKDPALWKVIHVDKILDDYEGDYDLEMLTRQAVDLSCGELIDISINYFGSGELLHYIVLCSSKLKRLSLSGCSGITVSCLKQAVKMLPQLEKLHLFNISIKAEDIEVIGRNCPQLKSFIIFNAIIYWQYVKCDDQAVAIAKNMPELRHLQILGNKMTNDGFQAILNGCPRLQSLYIHMYINSNLDQNLVKRCMERIKKFQYNSDKNLMTLIRMSTMGHTTSTFWL